MNPGRRLDVNAHVHEHDRYPVGDDAWLETLRSHDRIRIGRWYAPFDLVRRYYSSIRIPKAFQEPATTVLIEPTALKQRFLESNPTFKADSFAVLCSGRNLRELRVCLTKEGKPRPCGRDVRDQCSVEEAVMRPVR